MGTSAQTMCLITRILKNYSLSILNGQSCVMRYWTALTLRMSMPTCWCVKAIPNEVIEPLETIYREELKRAIPAASDDIAYITAYTEACGFWLLQQTIPFLNSVIDNDRVGLSGPIPENSL